MLKKTCIIIIIIIGLIGILHSQEISIGFRTGIGLSGNMTTPSYSGLMDISNSVSDTSTGSKPIFSFNGGILFNYLFNESNYGFEIQINYLRTGSKINNELFSRKDTLYVDNLEIAVPFKMSLLAFYGSSLDVHHPYLLIGPTMLIPLKAKFGGQDVKSSFYKVNFGILLGIGGRLRIGEKSIIFIELVSRFYLTDYLTSRGKMRNYTFHFNIGYELKLSTSDWD